MKQFFASRELPSDNAAPLYLTALAHFSGELGDGRGRTLAAAVGKLADVDRLRSGAISAAQVQQVLNDAVAGVQQLDLAQAKPHCVFVHPYTLDVLLPHVQATRDISRLTVLQLFHARQTSDFALAETAIRRCLRLSRDLQPRGFLVCQLVSIADDAVVLSGIERLTLNDPTLTAPQCDQLLQLLIEHEKRCLDRYDEALRTEYIVTRNSIEDVRSGRLTLEKLVDLTSPTASTKSRLPMASALNYEAEIAACNQLFALALEESKLPYAQTAATSRFRDELARLEKAAREAVKVDSPANKIDTAVIAILLAPALNAVREATTRAATHLAGVQSLIALRRYEITHGQLPASLAEATRESELRDVIPIDAFSSQPMRYSLSGNQPVVYSVGKDLQDNGGQEDWKYGAQPGDYLFPLTPRSGTRLTPSPADSAATAPAVTPESSRDPALREWTSAVGTKIEAAWVGMENDVAVLKKKDGSLLRVPLTRLSPADQRWIRESQSNRKLSASLNVMANNEFRDPFWYGRDDLNRRDVSVDDIKKVEASLKCRFPLEFSALLRRFNGGYPRRRLYRVPDPKAPTGEWILEIGSISSLDDIEEQGWFESDESLPRGLVQFATGRSGDELICFDYRRWPSRADPGIVFFNVMTGRDEIIPVADSFDELMRGMFHEWRADCVGIIEALAADHP